MPLAMCLGALLHHPIIMFEQAFNSLATPILIFLMLFITFCRVSVKELRFSTIYIWLIAFQFLISTGVFLLLHQHNLILAQGAMICILAPIAMGAVVIGGMLGANVPIMAGFALICNLTLALVAPYMLAEMGNGTSNFVEIFSKVAPLLILPFVVAQVARKLTPKVTQWVGQRGQIAFYLWLISLFIIIGKTTGYILQLGGENLSTQILLALASLIICLIQFGVGRLIGRRYSMPATGGQSLGQKNTVLAVWLAFTFLDPISSIAPTAYIIWQNTINSIQLYLHDKRKDKRQE